MKPAALRGLQLAVLRDMVASAATVADLDTLAAECDRRRSGSAAKLATYARHRARAIKAVATRRERHPPKPKSPPRGMSLVPFLVKLGGLRDPGGDVLAILGGTPRTRPGLVNNRSGLALDMAARQALLAGYFPEHVIRDKPGSEGASLAGALRTAGTGAETITPAALLDAIDAEMRGRKRWPGGVPPEAEQQPDPDREAHDAMREAECWREVVRLTREAGSGEAYQFVVSTAGITFDEIPW